MPSGKLIVILLLVLLNGFFALSELALVSAKRTRLQALAEQGKSGAKSALALMDDPTTLLSAIQIYITLITLVTGVYSGATFAETLGIRLASYGVPEQYAEKVAVGLVVFIVTYFALIGELVPKRVALSHAETLAVYVAPIMRVLARAA